LPLLLLQTLVNGIERANARFVWLKCKQYKTLCMLHSFRTVLGQFTFGQLTTKTAFHLINMA